MLFIWESTTISYLENKPLTLNILNVSLLDYTFEHRIHEQNTCSTFKILL